MTQITHTFHFDVPIEHKNYLHNLATPPHHSSERHQAEVTHTYKETMGTSLRDKVLPLHTKCLHLLP